MLNKYKLISLCIILAGCTGSHSDYYLDFKKYSFTKADLIIDANLDKQIAFPSFVRTAGDYFLVYDGQIGKIHKFNYHGDKLMSFGNKGRGPGEFQSVTNYWIMDDAFLFYDYNAAKLVYYNFQGSFVSEKPIKKEHLSLSNAMLSDNRFVLPANGENGALLKVVDYRTDDVFYLGRGYGDVVRPNAKTIRDLIKRTNRISEFFYNKVTVDAIGSDIYIVQNVTGKLQKYSIDEGLIWEMSIKIPSQEVLFDNYKEELFGQNRYLPDLRYAEGIQATDQGVAVLLNTPENEPVTIVWITSDGKQGLIIEYPTIEIPKNFLPRFRLAPEVGEVIFVNSLDGKVLKAEWPF